MQDSLEKAGAVIIGCAGKAGGGYVYKVLLPAQPLSALDFLDRNSRLNGIMDIQPEDKVEAKIYRKTGLFYEKSGNGRIKAEVRFYDIQSAKDVKSRYGQMIDSICDGKKYSNSFIVLATPDQLIDLAAYEAIDEIIEYRPPGTINYYARRLTHVDSLQALWGQPLQSPPTPGWIEGIPYTGDSIWVSNSESGSGGYQHLDICVKSGNDTLFRSADCILA